MVDGSRKRADGRPAAKKTGCPDPGQPVSGGEALLHAALVGLDHLLDHLAADRAGLAGGQVAVVALLEVDADLAWCSFSILKTESVCETPKTSRRILFDLHSFIRV